MKLYDTQARSDPVLISRSPFLVAVIAWFLSTLVSLHAQEPPTNTRRKEIGLANLPSIPAASLANHVREKERIVREYPKAARKLEGKLSEVMDRHERLGLTEARQFAGQRSVPISDDRVVVIVEFEEQSDRELISQELIKNNAVVVRNLPSHIKAKVPIESLRSVVETVPGIRCVRLPVKPNFNNATITQGKALMRAAEWHAAGYQGAGVKVAVIDGGFVGLASRKAGDEIPSSAIERNESASGMETVTEHGCAAAEIVYDMAPAAQMYLIKVEDESDLEAAKNYCVANGVHIVNNSQDWPLFNFYDGVAYGSMSPSPVTIVSNANANGILWVTSAGNYQQRHALVQWSDADTDGNMDWAPGVNINSIGYLVAGDEVSLRLTWNAWPTTDQDFDLGLLRWTGSAWNLVSFSSNPQNGSQAPIEGLDFTVTASGNYYVYIQKDSATASPYFILRSWVQILTYKGYNVTTAVPGSIACPADSSAALAVGAIDRINYTTGPVETYSSLGPNNGSYTGKPVLTKPDVCGPDNTASVTYGSFPGTSASSPHVAGIAALIKSKYPTYSNYDIRSYIESECTDLGAPGKDNTYGFGPAFLPAIDSLPRIITQPVNQTAALGQAVMFSVAAAGATPLNYQWQKNGTNVLNGGNISGAMTNVLNITSVASNDTGGYRVIVTNAFGSTTSSVATLLVQVEVPPGVLWQRTFGGATDDYLYSLQQTSDGGFVLGGYSASALSGNKTSTNWGNADYWIVKIDVVGNKMWEASFGGTNYDALTVVRQTGDGGYVLGGFSASPISGNKGSTRYGSFDYWIIKLDATGDKMWEASFGGTGDDTLVAVQETDDGGFVLGGYSASVVSGNKTSTNYGNYDFWVIKLDSGGNKLWERSFGGTQADRLRTLQQTFDGGFILGGDSQSGIGGSKTNTYYGGTDYWIIKLDSGGNKLWERSFGGSDYDRLYSLRQTSDTGYLLAGESWSPPSGNKSSASLGSSDYWVIKLEADGNRVWENSFGGTDQDQAFSAQQTLDGGYVLGGWSESGVSGNKASVGFGGWDYWIVKLNSDGSKFWEQSYGGSADDGLRSVLQVTDGGYLLGGYSSSAVSGNKTSTNYGTQDYWVIRLGSIAPSIIAGPEDQSLKQGSNATFTVTAAGTSPLTYRWQKNGTNLSNSGNISGATTNTLTVSNVTTNDTGSYRVIVTNAYGSVTSSVATLTIVFPPSIGSQPSSQTNVMGSIATFTVTAGGSSPLSYQWQRNGTNLASGGNISGATTNAVTISNVASNDAGDYRVIVANTYGSTTSSVATLTVVFPPSISSRPFSQTNVTGSIATFAVTASGTSPLSYQWQKNGTNLSNSGNVSGATTDILMINNVTTTDVGTYRVFITNAYGSDMSSSAWLVVAGFFDDFDPDIDLVQWSALSGSLATNHGGYISAPNSLWFGTTISRFAASRPLDTTPGGEIMFWLRIADGTNSPWERPELPTKGIVIEYSTNSGSNWVECGRYNTSNYWSWTRVALDIPEGAQTANTQFRWRQLANSGIGFDHWALDNVGVVIGPRSPTIVTQPASQTLVAGVNATFSVGAVGSSPLAYQWRKNDTAILQGTNASLVLSNVQTNDAGDYSVVVTNAHGNAVSSNGLLAILTMPPVILTQPQGLTVPTGANVTVSVNATGAIPLIYQWRKDGAILGEATNSALVFSSIQTNATGSYSVAVSNAYGFTISSNAVVTVMPSINGIFDDFEPGIDLTQWSAFGGTVGSQMLATNYGGAVSGINSLWVGASGSRFATALPVDTTAGGGISFWLRLADGATSPWEKVDLPAEAVVLEYSVNGGTNWNNIGTFDTDNYTKWTLVQVSIPPGAKSSVTYFRWRQLSWSGGASDHWALDDVSVWTASLPLPVILPPTQSQTDFVFAFTTDTSRSYTIEFKDQLNETVWHTLQTVQGDGSIKFITNSLSTASQRFFRLRVD